MFRNLAANLITHERVITTDPKAKELRRVAEKLITKAKRLGAAAYTPQAQLSDADKARRLHVSRQLESFIPRWGVEANDTKRNLIEKVLVELAKRFAERPGGYTRITKIGPRRGDGAPLAVIELVDAPEVQPKGMPGAPEAATAAVPAGGGASLDAAGEEKPSKKAKAGQKAIDETAAEEKPKAKKKADVKAEAADDKAVKAKAKKAKDEGDEPKPKSSKKK